MCIRGVLNKGGNEIAPGIASRQSAMPDRARERSIGHPGKRENRSISLAFPKSECNRKVLSGWFANSRVFSGAFTTRRRVFGHSFLRRRCIFINYLWYFVDSDTPLMSSIPDDIRNKYALWIGHWYDPLKHRYRCACSLQRFCRALVITAELFHCNKEESSTNTIQYGDCWVIIKHDKMNLRINHSYLAAVCSPFLPSKEQMFWHLRIPVDLWFTVESCVKSQQEK